MAFFDQVLARFKAFGEVLIDQGRKFFRSFEALYTKALIDHCTMSKNHLKTNGLIERIIQTIKRHIILHIKNLLSNGIFLLKGKDGQECWKHSKNCVPYHLHIDGSINLELIVMPIGLIYFICSKKKETSIILIYIQC
uniref:Integrase catalytic domain-containing protein n=2 Tax=Physcomitrium patens TaxID=3218 RepID=A0A7I4F635_PHYPA